MLSIRGLHLTATLGGLLCLAGFTPGLCAGEPFPVETHVAVVDVSRVFENYKRVNDVERMVEGEFTPRKQAIEKEGQELMASGAELKRMRDGMEGNSPLLFDEVQRFQKRQFLFERKRQNLEEALAVRMREEMRNVLNEIKAAIRKEAERRHIHLVLRSPDAVDPIEAETAPGGERNPAPAADDGAKKRQKEIKDILAPKTLQELLLRLRRNPVLFGSQTADITAEVLRALNQDYAKLKGGRETSK